MSGFDPKDPRVKEHILRVAVARLRGLTKARQDYDDEVAEWYSRGDGRSPKWVDATIVYKDEPDSHLWGPVNMGGKGYTYPACIHGYSRWTDYDNICPGCEDGYTDRQVALADAWNAVKDFYERTDLMMQMLNLHAPGQAVSEVGEWSTATIRVTDHVTYGSGKILPAAPGLLPALDPKRLP